MNYVVRRWDESDIRFLQPLVRAYLESTYNAGEDLLPTEHNVNLILQVGLHSAKQGNPTLVAIDEQGSRIGFHLCYMVELPFDLRDRVLQSAAIYISPRARSSSLAHYLLELTSLCAKQLGYTRVDGAVRSKLAYKKLCNGDSTASGLLISRKV